MSTDTEASEQAPLRVSLFRSFLTEYWPFTAYVLAYMTVGVALAAATGTADLYVWGVYAVALWLGLEGLHAIDLSDETVAVQYNSTVQFWVGVAGLAAGVGVGVYLASITTWWFLLFVGAETFLGIAYNVELFGGALHDFDRPTGMANFAVSWGFLPFLGGFFIMSQSLSIGILVFGVGLALDAARLILMFEAGKPAPYEDLGIEYDRVYTQRPEWLGAATHQGNKMMMVSWSLMAAGLMLLFAL
jgi:hypothetical protein